MKLHNRVVVITGGTSGIGYELVRQLSECNTVLVIARASQRLTALERNFPGVQIHSADLASLTDIERVANSILQDHTCIDLLINNAAVQYTPFFMDETFCYETIAREITLNFTAVCSLCYLFLPALLQDRETMVVNIGSALGFAPKAASAVYCATKGAMNIFTQSLRYQLENTPVRVSHVILPLVDTPMTAGRGHGKISAAQAACQIVSGLEKGATNIVVGKVKLLRLMLLVAPGIARKMMKGL